MRWCCALSWYFQFDVTGKEKTKHTYTRKRGGVFFCHSVQWIVFFFFRSSPHVKSLVSTRSHLLYKLHTAGAFGWNKKMISFERKIQYGGTRKKLRGITRHCYLLLSCSDKDETSDTLCHTFVMIDFDVFNSRDSRETRVSPISQLLLVICARYVYY